MVRVGQRRAEARKAYCAEGEQVMRASARRWPTLTMGQIGRAHV